MDILFIVIMPAAALLIILFLDDISLFIKDMMLYIMEESSRINVQSGTNESGISINEKREIKSTKPIHFEIDYEKSNSVTIQIRDIVEISDFDIISHDVLHDVMVYYGPNKEVVKINILTYHHHLNNKKEGK